MKIKQNTAATIEPVTLAEVKTHLRLDSTSFADNITTYQSIVPGDHAIAASYSLTGSSVDVSGNKAVVIFDAGACGSSGTVDVKIQESEDDSTWSDWAGGAFTQVTESNDNAVQEKEYTGTYQYIRVVATVATATCDFGVSVNRYEFTAIEDTYLNSLIPAVTKHIELNVLGGVSLLQQTWELYLDKWPDEDYIELPRPPLQSVTSITYTESGDSSTYGNTFSSSYYTVDTVSWPGRIVLNDGDSWPTGTLETNNPIKVIFPAGYGDARADVPGPIKQCHLMYCDDYYNNRGVHEEVKFGDIKRLPAADHLVASYCMFGF